MTDAFLCDAIRTLNGRLNGVEKFRRADIGPSHDLLRHRARRRHHLLLLLLALTSGS
jgi:hypothetical protein